MNIYSLYNKNMLEILHLFIISNNKKIFVTKIEFIIILQDKYILCNWYLISQVIIDPKKNFMTWQTQVQRKENYQIIHL